MQSLEKVVLCSTEKDGPFFTRATGLRWKVRCFEIYPAVCRDLGRLLLKDIFPELVRYTFTLDSRKLLLVFKIVLVLIFSHLSLHLAACNWMLSAYLNSNTILGLCSHWQAYPTHVTIPKLSQLSDFMRSLPFLLLYLCPHQSTL